MPIIPAHGHELKSSHLSLHAMVTSQINLFKNDQKLLSDLLAAPEVKNSSLVSSLYQNIVMLADYEHKLLSFADFVKKYEPTLYFTDNFFKKFALAFEKRLNAQDIQFLDDFQEPSKMLWSVNYFYLGEPSLSLQTSFDVHAFNSILKSDKEYVLFVGGGAHVQFLKVALQQTGFGVVHEHNIDAGGKLVKNLNDIASVHSKKALDNVIAAEYEKIYKTFSYLEKNTLHDMLTSWGV